jgi:uncharacterized membrane protein
MYEPLGPVERPRASFGNTTSSGFREKLMLVRSAVLFVHVVGMLVLFVGLALEWVNLESLRRSATPLQGSTWIRVLRALPRYVAIAVGLIVVSGIYLAARVGVFDFAWVRVSLGAMVTMGILGGPVVRAQMRAVLHAGDQDGAETATMLRRYASHPLLHASLRTRVAVGLAIVYMMIGKPDLGESLLLIGMALVVGAVTSVPQWRAQLSAVEG